MPKDRTDKDLTAIFDTIEYPVAYRITYLANTIVFPAYEAIKRDFGLVRAEYVLLACLSHFDALTAQDIANISRRPRNTISRAVHRMLADGHIARTPDPHDGRQSMLRITSSGRQLHDKIAMYLKDRQNKVFATLTPQERHTLSELLKKAALNAALLES